MKRSFLALAAFAVILAACQDDDAGNANNGFGLDTSVDLGHDSSDPQDGTDDLDGTDGRDATTEEDADDPGADWAACSAPVECTLEFNTCCHTCGEPTLADYDAVNVDKTDAHREEVCPEPSPCPGCAAMPTPWLVATCASGTCQGVALRQSDVTSCTSDQDCRIRTSDCCECGGNSSRSGLVAVSDSGAFAEIVCGDAMGCPECAPQYPAEAREVCADDGHCEVVWEQP